MFIECPEQWNCDRVYCNGLLGAQSALAPEAGVSGFEKGAKKGEPSLVGAWLCGRADLELSLWERWLVAPTIREDCCASRPLWGKGRVCFFWTLGTPEGMELLHDLDAGPSHLSLEGDREWGEQEWNRGRAAFVLCHTVRGCAERAWGHRALLSVWASRH